MSREEPALPLRQVAVHEAGHAAAAIWLGRPLRKHKTLTIVPKQGSLGAMMLRKYVTQQDSFYLCHLGFNPAKTRALNDCIVSLAGPAAEKIVLGIGPHDSQDEDHESARDLVFRM